MLDVTQINFIKEQREKKEKSIAEIAREMGISWRTAKKYADGSTPVEPQRPKQQRRKRVLADYTEYIDAMLEEDLLAPAKQRRPAAAIHRALQVSHSFTGSLRTVSNYVRTKKAELRANKEQFVRLDHPPGSVQVDFGQFHTIEPIGDEPSQVKRHELSMSFPHSNASKGYALPAENGECFLEGLRALFEEIGGVPPVIWLDNLAAAVIIRNKKRELTDLFRNFMWHYRFEARFCNPGKGNEKGHVENKVGYTRRNHLSPMPVIQGLTELNTWQTERSAEDRQRLHYSKGKLIEELFLEDRQALLPLPTEPFIVARSEMVTTNKYGEFKLGEEIYRIPQAAIGQRLFIKIHAFHLDIFNESGETKITTVPRQYALDVTKIDWAANLAIFVRKPRAVEHANCLKALPLVLRDYILDVDLRERPTRVKILVELLREHPLPLVVQVFTRARELGIEPDDLLTLRSLAAYQANSTKENIKPLLETATPSAVRSWQPNLESYSLLQKEASSDE